jgi:uncharacterized protein (DUF427 family)
MQARWNGVVLAESDQTVHVECNQYFPPDSIRSQLFSKTHLHTVCPWKGIASYYTLTVDGQNYKNIAWYYPHPSPLARKIKNHVAFHPAIEIIDTPARPAS